MLGNQDAVVTIAVKDLTVAQKFYEDKLGLKKVDLGDSGQEEEVLSLKSGSSRVNVYRSKYAGTNQATAATWVVPDVDGTVRDLKAKGVAFERYDLPEMNHEGDVHVAGKLRAAWFKDPDGNILSLVNP